MKQLLDLKTFGVALLSLSLGASSAVAAIVVPSDGSDGPLNITSNTVIDLGKAVTASWSTPSGSPGNGVYDSNNWTVVFKYSSVSVAQGASLTFINHPSHAPVVWLVGGDVTVAGDVSLDGAPGINAGGPGVASYIAEAGPGGFRGGPGFFVGGIPQGAGFGPGGGQQSAAGGSWGAPGSFGSLGGYGSTTYGNPSLIPLIGGSGGGGWYGDSRSGGAGGGAILIASSGTVTVSGSIHANGGGTYAGTGDGSGGAIRLVANAILGSGNLRCGDSPSSGNAGGLGRIRIERVTVNGNLQVAPDPSVVTLQDGATPLIWLPSDGPTARIVSIGSVNAPADPRASFGAFGPDVTLPQVTTTPVVVETSNVEAASVVVVRVTPRAGAFTEVGATLTQTNSTSPLVLRWTANIPVGAGYASVLARVVRP